LPAGSYGGSYVAYGNEAIFWSATESNNGNTAYYRYLYYDWQELNQQDESKYYGRSVRCIRDE
jgi:uncharacterized protein (TIGR02145 family)